MARYRIVRIADPEGAGARYDVERRCGLFSWEWIGPFPSLAAAEDYVDRLKYCRAVVRRYY
jgi:hypothetical protein